MRPTAQLALARGLTANTAREDGRFKQSSRLLRNARVRFRLLGRSRRLANGELGRAGVDESLGLRTCGALVADQAEVDLTRHALACRASP